MSAADVLAVENPYGLRQRPSGFYVLVSQASGNRIATYWTAKEERARQHVRRQGHYGVRFSRAENGELVGGAK